MHPHTVIIICGPTAVGKTSFAIRLANYIKTDIISADSRQCYQELNIGVAKPSEDELAAIHHYFINSHSIDEEVNAGVFEEYSLQAAKKIFIDHTTAVMVGGTGLYIKSFCEGMDDIPQIDPVIRKQITKEYEEGGIEYLQGLVAEKDPVFWRTAEQQNPQRLRRALEVILSTGKSITVFHQGRKARRDFNIVKIGFELSKEQLYNNINTRVDLMMRQGLADEVYNLRSQRHNNALQTVGYRELFSYLDGDISLQQAVTNIKTNTRHYAKRQLTWFKKDKSITWCASADEETFQRVADNLLVAAQIN